jgi:hypothetical protein
MRIIRALSSFSVFCIIFLCVLSGCSDNTTLEEAIDKDEEWNEVFYTTKINDEFALAFMEVTEGKVEVGLVVRSENGWKTTDTTGVLGVHDHSIGFGGMSGPLYKDKAKNEFIVLSWGLIVDEDIETIEVMDNKGKEVNIIESDYGTKIYYIVDEKIKDISIAYKLFALSKDGEILYDKS